MEALYSGYADAAAMQYGIDPAILRSLIKTESSWNAAAMGSAGEIGLGQVKPNTAKWLGYDALDLYDPAKNVGIAADYLSKTIAKAGGDVRTGLALYNSGINSKSPNYSYADKVLAGAGVVGNATGNAVKSVGDFFGGSGMLDSVSAWIKSKSTMIGIVLIAVLLIVAGVWKSIK